MERIALMDSVLSSNAIEGIVTTADREVPLVFGSTKPRGHSESEIADYSAAFGHIHRDNCSILLSRKSILIIYGILMSGINYPVSKRDIIAMFPDLSETTIERVLGDAGGRVGGEDRIDQVHQVCAEN